MQYLYTLYAINLKSLFIQVWDTMKYEKSMKQIIAELEEWKENFKKLQEELIHTMETVNDDIGFALTNKDLDHAETMQTVFYELKQLSDGVNPLVWKQICYVIDLLKDDMKEGENAKEHKTTAKS